MNDENQITTTFAKNDTPKLIKLSVLGIAAVVFIIALTMKLVPWGSQTAAGILLGLSALCMVGMLGLSAQDRIKERHKALGITGKDERVRQARQRAFAMVGKIAVVGCWLWRLFWCVWGRSSPPPFSWLPPAFSSWPSSGRPSG